MQVKFMPTMDVVMHNSLDNSEISRTISKTGTITRHFYLGDVQILFANGNVSNFNSKTKSWIWVNNKGEQREVFIDNPTEEKHLPNLLIEERTDPETKCLIKIRSDKVMIVYYPDHTLVLHNDGTNILKSTDGQLTIEKLGLPSITIKKVR